MLLAPSGYGKTFTLYDYMAKHVCIYLTCSTQGNSGDGLMSAPFCPDRAFPCLSSNAARNSSILKILTLVVLTLHVEALDDYLANSRTADPYCWLLYHCYANENDIRQLQRIYQHLSVTSCEGFERIEFSLQSRLLKTFELMSPRLHNFAFIIDDAQELFSINPYYLSDNGQIRYAFAPVMSAFKSINSVIRKRVFVAGTRVESQDLTYKTEKLKRGKPVIINFDAIENIQTLRECIDWISPSFAQCFSEAQLQQILNQLAGRYRLIAKVLTTLLAHCSVVDFTGNNFATVIFQHASDACFELSACINKYLQPNSLAQQNIGKLACNYLFDYSDPRA